MVGMVETIAVLLTNTAHCKSFSADILLCSKPRQISSPINASGMSNTKIKLTVSPAFLAAYSCAPVEWEG